MECSRSTHGGSGNWAALFRAEAIGGLEFMQATYTSHAFPPHIHETYVIELVESGVDEFSCQGTVHRASAGSLILLNPFEVHTGRSAGRVPLRYQSLYPTTGSMAEAASELGWPKGCVPTFPHHVVRDRHAADLFLQCLKALQGLGDAGGAPQLLMVMLTWLVRHYGQFDANIAASDTSPGTIQRARAYLTEHLSENTTLHDLADQCGLSPFHLARRFQRECGLPPHAFLINLRVENARRRLADGQPVADVALSLGFSDQSHLTRCFRRLVGTTPGQYQRNRMAQNPSQAAPH